MKINVKDYFNDKQWRKIKRVADRNETPFLVVNLDVIRQRWDELKQSMPYAKIYYAVKANPAKEVLELLRDLGSCFDVASVYEDRKSVV